MKTLNLKHDKLACMPVEFDEIGLLHILTPTKGLFEELMRVIPATQGLAGAQIDAETAASALNDIYRVCAHIISRNTERKAVSPEDVERLLMISDIIVFIEAYVSFITDTTKTNEKN